MRIRIRILLWLLAGLECFAAPFTLPAHFGDGMVLQANEVNFFYGTAEPGESIAIQIGDRKPMTVTANKKTGAWSANIRMSKCSDAPFDISFFTGKERNKLAGRIQNVVIGEVWIFATIAGQGLPAKGTPQQIRYCAPSDLNLRNADSLDSWMPQTSGEGQTPGIESLAYQFALRRQQTNCPIGILQLPIALLEDRLEKGARAADKDDPALAKMLSDARSQVRYELDAARIAQTAELIHLKKVGIVTNKIVTILDYDEQRAVLRESFNTSQPPFSQIQFRGAVLRTR